MPGADELYVQFSSALQIFCTGKITSTRTSNIRINVPIREDTAPDLITMSECLMVTSNQSPQFLILCGSMAAKLYDSFFETCSNLLLKYWNGRAPYTCLSHKSCTPSKYTFLGSPFILKIS